MMKLLFLSLSVFINTYRSNDWYVNTNWVAKVANKYTESFNFKQNKYVIHYSKLSEYTYHGCYSILKDTLIIKERDNSKGNEVTYHRIKFLLKDETLYPVSYEDMVNHKWEKSKKLSSKNQTFKRVI